MTHSTTYFSELNLAGVSGPLLLILDCHARVVVVRGVPYAVEVVAVRSPCCWVHEEFPRKLHKGWSAYYLVLESHQGGVSAVVLVHEGENRLQVASRWRGLDASRRVFFEEVQLRTSEGVIVSSLINIMNTMSIMPSWSGFLSASGS